MDARIVVLVVLCALTTSASGYLFFKTNSLKGEIALKDAELAEVEKRVNLPIDAPTAIDIAKEDPEFISFANKYFKDPNLRVELASLQLDEELGYIWKVELIERKCGCGGRTNLNSMEFYIDPETGKILKRIKNIGVSEDVLARKSCEKGCH
jgi:hypothetical protein